jgi:hypothetical protein
MNSSDQNRWIESSGSGAPDAAEFEATLRLIAHLPLPEGLEDRLHATLRAAEHSTTAPVRPRILPRPQAARQLNAWIRSSLGRAAAAAAIVLVVVSGGWGIYSRVQPPQTAKTIVPPPRMSASGGLSSAGAMRTPKTLNGPMVAHPATASQPARPAGQSKRAPSTPLRRAKAAAAAKSIAPPVAPAAK